MNTIDMESIHYLSDLAKFDDWFASREREQREKEEMVMRLLNVM